MLRARPVGVALGLALLLPLAIRWADVTAFGIIPAVQSLWSLWVLITAAVMGVLVVRRRWRLVCHVLPAALLAMWVVLQTHLTAAHVEPAAGNGLCVVSVNMKEGRGSTADVADAVGRRHADVLVLVEVDPMLVRDLVADPRMTGFRYSSGPPRGSSIEGSVILSRWPVTEVRADFDVGRAHHLHQPALTVVKQGTRVRVQAVHPYPPILDGATDWRAALRALEVQKAWLPAGQPFIIAGDFNAGPEHPAFRQLAHHMTDSSAGRSGLSRTWPSTAPFTRLDHILTSSASTVDGGQFRVQGTDHLGVWARLNLPD